MDSIPHQTLVILKPECIENCIVGGVMSFFDRVGLRPVAMKIVTGTKQQFSMHYSEVIERVGNTIGDQIIERMCRGPCVFIVYECGGNAVVAARGMLGVTDPAKALPETIRGHYGGSVQYNTAHASDSAEAANREISLWFPEISPPQRCNQGPVEFTWVTGC